MYSSSYVNLHYKGTTTSLKLLRGIKKNKDSLTDIENCLLAILESFWWNIIKPGPLPLFAEIRHCLL